MHDIEKKSSAGENVLVFSLRYFQNYISSENLIAKCTQRGQLFPILGYFLSIFKKQKGKPPTLPLSSCVPKLIYFLKVSSYSTNFFIKAMSKFSKNSLLTLKSPALLGQQLPYFVKMIMTETDRECGDTKTTLYIRDVNKSCKMITFSHLNSSNFNNNFMQEKVKSIFVVLILSFARLLFIIIIWEHSQIAF